MVVLPVRRHLLAAAGVAAAAALACDPALRVPVVLTADVAAVAAPWVGMARYRPSVRAPWMLISAMMAVWTAGMVAMGAHRPMTASVLVVVGQVLACVLVIFLFVGRERQAAREESTLGRRIDAVLLVVVVGVVVAQAVSNGTASASRTPSWLAATSAVDVLLAGLIIRFLLSRAQLRPSSLVGLMAALGTVVFDILQIHTGHRSAPLGHPVDVLWTVDAGLFAVAALHPSMPLAFDPATLRSRRTESVRLTGLVPLAAVPAALYALDAEGRLPTPIYLAAGAVFGALGLLRGAMAVRRSEWLAARDPLTGLVNRRGLARAFDALLARPRGGHGLLCLLDLDDFKQVNDTGGHDAGDALLREVGRRLEAAVGSRGTVSRSGGDEFVVLLAGLEGLEQPGESAGPDQLDDGVRAVQDLLDSALGPPLAVAGRPHRIGVSAGVAAVAPGATLTHVLADADVALYAAKSAGKGTATGYHPRLREAVLGALALVADLRTVLDGERGAGELQVHYQPLVELCGGRVVGFEALVRWRHPERGLVAPDDFLPLAEEHGLATRLDRWVMVEALRQLARWDAAGAPRLRVSVNLGRSSMLADDLADAVLSVLDATGLPCSRLRLEITEHDELPATAGVDALRALGERGVGVGLDDFGVGYTSLDYLRRYPVDQLKLDRSMTAPLESEATSPLVEGIVALAHRLGMTVLAEGIETAAQRERLAALGIELGQGYHFARPMPAAGVTELLGAGWSPAGSPART